MPIGLLLNQNKRLVFLNQINEASNEPKYDSYSESFYAITDVNKILAALAVMKFLPPAGETYTLLQLQGTSTAETHTRARPQYLMQ